MHPSTEAIPKFFTFEHLPEKLQAISALFSKLARSLANDFEGPDLAGLGVSTT
jgi:hypothetical protein